jgi:hypothetical protein
VTPLEASVEAVALEHGLAVGDLIQPQRGNWFGHQRRVAAYVAATVFKVPLDDIDTHFQRAEGWALKAMETIGQDARRNPAVFLDIARARDRARALLDLYGKAPQVAKASPLSPSATQEAKRLRAKGWAIPGLAKRYGITPQQMAPIVGETWGPQP